MLVLTHVISGQSEGKSTRKVARLFRRFRITFRQCLKQMQTLTIVAGFSVSYPETVRTIMYFVSSFSAILQEIYKTVCLANKQSVALIMGWTWSLPLLVVMVAGTAALVSHPLKWCLSLAPHTRVREIARTMDIGVQQFIIFLYLLWSIYFAAILRGVTVIMTCTRSPQGHMMVVEFPQLECFSEAWLPLLPGFLASLFLFVVCYFAISLWAVRQVAHAMRQTGCVDRGPLAFVTDGTRNMHIYWHIFSSLKDTLLSATAVIFTGDGTIQLLVASMLLCSYGVMVAINMPYISFALNFLEISSTAGLFCLLIFSASTGFQSDPGKSPTTEPGDENYNSRAAWMLGIVLVFSNIQLLFLAYEVVMFIPFVRSRLPESLQPTSPEKRKQTVQDLEQKMTAAVRDQYLVLMDDVEWQRYYSSLRNAHSTRKFSQHIHRTGSIRQLLMHGRFDVGFDVDRSFDSLPATTQSTQSIPAGDDVKSETIEQEVAENEESFDTGTHDAANDGQRSAEHVSGEVDARETPITYLQADLLRDTVVI